MDNNYNNYNNGQQQGGFTPQGDGQQPDMQQQGGFTPQGDMGAYTNMNQGMGVYPNANQGMGAYPNANQGMGMNYGTNPQYGMGAQPASGGGKPPKVKKPMSKGKLIGIITGGVVAAAAVICGVIFIPRFIKSDKEVVIDAFENTFESDKESDFSTDVLGYDDIMTAMNETGYSQKVEYSIDSVAGLDTSGTSLSSDINYDPVNKLISGGIDFSYNDNSFMSFNVMGDEDNTYIQLADLIDGYFSIPNDLSEFADAPIFSTSDTSVDFSGLVLDYFPDTTGDDGQTLNSNYVDAVEGLWDSVSVEKQGKAKVDVNGTTVKAKEYYITLAEEDIESAASSMLDGVSEIALADPDALEEAGMDEDTFTESMQQLKDMVPSLINGDLVVKVYVADKKVVKIAASDKITIMYVDVNYDIYMDLDDNDASGKFSLEAMGSEIGFKYDVKDIHGNANGTITAYAPGDNVDLTFNVTKTGNEKSFTGSLAYNASELAGISGAYSFDDSTYEGNLSMDLSITDVGEFGISMQTAYENITKGVGYTAAVKDLSVTMNGETLLSMSGTGTLDTSSVSASQIDSSLPVYDLSTMTSDELSSVIIDNYDNITVWSENFSTNSGIWGEMFSSLSSLIYGTSEDDYYIDEYDDSEYNDGDSDSDTYTDEDTTLEDSNGNKVQITGCIDGFTLDYACSFFIDYYTDNYSYIEYTLENGASAEELLTTFTENNSIGVDGEISNQSIDVDGETVYYSMVYYNEAGDTPYYMFAKEVADGTFLCATAIIYPEDSYTVEQLAKALSGQYYTIAQ